MGRVILVTWTLADGTKGSKEFPDDQLDEILRRTHAKFGNDGGATEGAQRENENVHAGMAGKTKVGKRSRYRA